MNYLFFIRILIPAFAQLSLVEDFTKCDIFPSSKIKYLSDLCYSIIQTLDSNLIVCSGVAANGAKSQLVRVGEVIVSGRCQDNSLPTGINLCVASSFLSGIDSSSIRKRSSKNFFRAVLIEDPANVSVSGLTDDENFIRATIQLTTTRQLLESSMIPIAVKSIRSLLRKLLADKVGLVVSVHRIDGQCRFELASHGIAMVG